MLSRESVGKYRTEWCLPVNRVDEKERICANFRLSISTAPAPGTRGPGSGRRIRKTPI